MSLQPPIPETLLAAALEIDSRAERRAYLDRACLRHPSESQEAAEVRHAIAELNEKLGAE